MVSKKTNLTTTLFGIFLLFLSYFSPAVAASCPVKLEQLCVSARVQALVDVQHEIEHMEDPADPGDRFEKQARIIKRMVDIGLIRHAVTYIAERNISLGHANAANEIVRVAVTRSIEVFKTLPRVMPVGMALTFSRLWTCNTVSAIRPSPVYRLNSSLIMSRGRFLAMGEA